MIVLLHVLFKLILIPILGNVQIVKDNAKLVRVKFPALVAQILVNIYIYQVAIVNVQMGYNNQQQMILKIPRKK